jgi:hypothetical protein
MSNPVSGTSPGNFFRLVRTILPLPPGISVENWDTDGDNLTNWAELTTYGSNPLLADTDADGLADDWEVAHGLNVLDDGTKDPQHGPNAPFSPSSQAVQSSQFTQYLQSTVLTNSEAFIAGVQAIPGATIGDLDGDLVPNAQDADPRSTAVNWSRTSKPAYVAIPVPSWNPILHSRPDHLNNQNDILTPTAIYRNGQWVYINSHGRFLQVAKNLLVSALI